MKRRFSVRPAVCAGTLLVGMMMMVPAPALADAVKLRPMGNDIAPLPESTTESLRKSEGLSSRSGGAAARSLPTAGSGFIATASPFDFSETRTRSSYTLRLVSNGQGNVETMRSAAEAAAADVASASGTAITVAAGTIPDTTLDREPDPGEILLSIDDSAPCVGVWAGCGGVRNMTYRSWDRAGLVNSGRMWIHSMVQSYTTAQQNHVVAHELGHALGLDHFDGTHSDGKQVMHSSAYDASAYRAGDRNGFAFLAQAPLVGAVRSVNGDHKSDLIATNPSNNTVVVTTSTGSSFNGAGTGAWINGWSMPAWMEVGDFNGDGNADLAANNPSNDTVAVALSDGSQLGAAGTGTWLNAWGNQTWMRVGDVNGDGKSDLVALDPTAHTVSVRLSNGSSFGSANVWRSSVTTPNWMETGDANGDGKADLILTDPSTNTVVVRLSTGSSFGSATAWVSGWSMPAWMRVGDFNGDGKADLAATDPSTNTVAVTLSTGTSFNGPGSSAWTSGWSMPIWMRAG